MCKKKDHKSLQTWTCTFLVTEYKPSVHLDGDVIV